MAVKIYTSGGAIVLNNAAWNPIYQVINPSAFDWQVNNGIYSVRDKIQNQSYELGIFSDIQNEQDTPFASDADLIAVLNSLMFQHVKQDEQLDNLTKSLIIIHHTHHEIHDGNHYFYNDSVELDNAATQDYLITTSDNSCHLKLDFDGSTITQFELFEATDKEGTVLQDVYNNNRNSLNASNTTVHKGTNGGTTDGTRLKIFKGGSSTNQSKGSAGSRDEEEVPLKINTKYIFRITSGANDNLCNVGMYWYE